MVRINLIQPQFLTDQHLMAEFNEILMLCGYVKKHPEEINIPQKFTLGKGHIKFFKNKLLYLQQRHKLLKEELLKRNYNVTKDMDINIYDNKLKNDFTPTEKDKNIIKDRIIEKLKMKPNYYTYYRKHENVYFYTNLIHTAI
jgi:deoxyribonuclease (pyrimidine dimer)